MKKSALLLMLLGAFAAQHALAEEDVIDKAGKGIKKGGEAAGHGIERGVDATGNGVKKGAKAAGKGIRKGAEATGKGLKKAGEWLENKSHKNGDK